jgi:ATP-binding cassette, subfamily C, bacterial CydD
MRPFDRRLVTASKSTTVLIVGMALIALAILATTIALAFVISELVIGFFQRGESVDQNISELGQLLMLAGVRAGLVFLQEMFSTFLSQKIKLDLRERALLWLVNNPGESAGRWSYLLGPGLDSLDVYFSKYLPQLILAAVATPAFIILLFTLDPLSAMVVFVTLPLIPLFMILIGLVTKEAQNRQLGAVTLLNQHFLEVLRGLTTLKIFNRTQRQVGVLSSLSVDHKQKTMRVLRVSFLSGFALELAASLSVALIAVSIGIRLIDGEIGLSVGLLVLLLAPEVYLPLRQVGALFHSSKDAVEVTETLFDSILKTEESAVDRLEVKQGLTVLTGPSGTGKSTLLRRMSDRSAYMPQQPIFLDQTIQENILAEQNVNAPSFQRAIEMAAIQELPLGLKLSERAPLSGGQLQRVSLARALYRHFETGLPLVLDEPLSQLDPALVDLISERLVVLARSGSTIIAASHQRQLIDAADYEVKLG